MCLRIAAVALLLPFMALTALAQGMGRQPDALKNMRSVSVKAISLDKAVMSDAQLQTQVELRLRRAGVPVKECEPKTVCVPEIFVKVAVFYVKAKGDLMMSIITIQCNTVVAAVGQPERRLLATVWMNENTIAALDSATIRDQIDQLVDEFANDYLSVNPK